MRTIILTIARGRRSAASAAWQRRRSRAMYIRCDAREGAGGPRGARRSRRAGVELEGGPRGRRRLRSGRRAVIPRAATATTRCGRPDSSRSTRSRSSARRRTSDVGVRLLQRLVAALSVQHASRSRSRRDCVRAVASASRAARQRRHVGARAGRRQTAAAGVSPARTAPGAPPARSRRFATIRRSGAAGRRARHASSSTARCRFTTNGLASPTRVFLDLPRRGRAAALRDRTLRFDGDADIVRQVRVGRHPNNTTRVVLDATGSRATACTRSTTRSGW